MAVQHDNNTITEKGKKNNLYEKLNYVFTLNKRTVALV